MPGIPASTSETWLFGSPPNAVEAPENSFEFEVTWAWISMPITTSQSPVCPLISLPLVTVILVNPCSARRRSAPTRPPVHPSPPAGRPGGTNSRHWKDHPRHGADRHGPTPRPCCSRPARSCGRHPSRPSRPTTARPAAARGRRRALHPRGWLSGQPCSPPFRRREAAGRLLDDLAKREQRLLVEGTSDQLQ